MPGTGFNNHRSLALTAEPFAICHYQLIRRLTVKRGVKYNHAELPSEETALWKSVRITP